MKLFDLGFDKKIEIITHDFECSVCGTSAWQVLIKGRTTDKYETVKGEKRRLIIEAETYGPTSACNCQGQILIANKEVESPNDLSPLKSGVMSGYLGTSGTGTLTSYLGTSGTSRPEQVYEEEDQRPFFMTVVLSEKGERVGLVEKEDGIYTKFGTKLIDRELLVK